MTKNLAIKHQSMVYGFVEQSGGTMTIDSVLGQGTTVSLYFPASAANEGGSTADSEPASAQPQTDRLTILVVEDDDDVRSVVCAQLMAMGHRVHPVADGRSAIAFLRSATAVDLLLTDVVLPGGTNGPDIVRVASQLRPDLKSIFMSGYMDLRTDDEILRTTKSDILSKPFTEAQLAGAIAATRQPVH